MELLSAITESSNGFQKNSELFHKGYKARFLSTDIGDFHHFYERMTFGITKVWIL